jgi:hypothetical protein
VVFRVQSNADSAYDEYVLATQLIGAFSTDPYNPYDRVLPLPTGPWQMFIDWVTTVTPVTSRTADSIRNRYLQHKLYGNESLASINDINRMLNDMPFLNSYNVFKVGPLVHIAVQPFAPSVEDYINAKLAGALFTYVIEAM